jgi:spore cortex formation protein SpoVR/YcgB (stage V sporulation)
MANKPLFKGAEWDFDLIKRAMDVLNDLAPELKLDLYPNQIEIITSEQMLDSYASVGLPVMYKHWSFGKKFSYESDMYRQGKRGLAYEIVLNTNPCINFLMEENSAMTQVLVLAHAAFGHNHVFKNNYLFKQWTDAASIVDYLNFSKGFISECEEKYGLQAVEQTLDSAHALMNHGVDRSIRPPKLSFAKEQERKQAREIYLQEQVNELWKTLPKQKEKPKEDNKFLKEPEENLLYFLEKKSPKLELWQRELLRIVRKISQYFEPQRATKVLNEGWASFTHYYLVNRLWDKGYLEDGSMLEFYQLHTSVLYQPDFNSEWYSGLNPYYLGFEIFSEIKRICTEPTAEDEEFFPELIGANWVDACLDAVANYRDESLIRQYLSPTLCRKLKLFLLKDDNSSDYTVNAIHNENGYKTIRRSLADSYLIENHIPKIEVVNVDYNTRKLTLMYHQKNNRRLSEKSLKVVRHIENLWGFPVEIINESGEEIKF